MSLPPELAGHQDRLRWNARYQGHTGDGTSAPFRPHPLAARALSLPGAAPGGPLPGGPLPGAAPGGPLPGGPLPGGPLPGGPLPDGPVLDLACGPSGSALAAASAGRAVTAVDISEVALGLLEREARRRGVSDLITLVPADLRAWRPQPLRYALVLCTGYWDRQLFGPAAEAVAAHGLLGWEAFTTETRRSRPSRPAQWCLEPGEPASLLPPGFTVIEQRDLGGGDSAEGPSWSKRRLLARRG